MSLFSGEASWFNIPAGRPFLDDLARRLFEELGPPGQDILAEAIVLLPNRRAGRALSRAFVKAAGQSALILPQIRALGDLDEGEPPFEPGDIALDLPPPISPWRRRFELTRLVRDHMGALGRDLDAAGALELADALGAFFDSLEIEEIADRDRIESLVEADLARHWEKSASFLNLAVREWPKRLEALGLADPAQRRIALLRRLADNWSRIPPAGPVIAAGSTGSVKASASLLAVIARARRGCVVLPGLDLNLADEAWDKIDDQHPQFALKGLLESARITREDVKAWDETTEKARRWRRKIINEALRPADSTGDWVRQIGELKKEAGEVGETDPVRRGLEGLVVHTARAEDDAAAAVALLLREALETPGRTAALVTPDTALARRVSARLARWGVEADSSAGTPLADCPVGVLLGLLARHAADPADPVILLGMLKHPLVRLGLTLEELTAGRTIMERHALRGSRPGGWAEIRERLTAREVSCAFALRVEAALTPLAAAFADGAREVSEIARAVAETAERLAQGPQGGTGALWAGPAGEAAAGLLAALMGEAGALSPMTAAEFERLTDHLLTGESVRPAPAAHPRLQILGAIEARLTQADLVVMAGLEEGVWPPAAGIDPFVSRPMRRRIGLPSPERRIGLSAHDFTQLTANPEVALIHCERRGGQPAVKSRWLWRLETLAGGAGLGNLPRHPHLAAWVAALDAAETPPQPARPAPKPLVAHRPRELYVTQVETLVRDPYAVWARRILGLRVLDRPDKAVDVLERGSAIHKALEDLAGLCAGGVPDDAAERFKAFYLERLRAAGATDELMTRETALADEIARWIAGWERERREGGPTVLIEETGEATFSTGAGRFTLKAKSDRLEISPDGIGHVLDFKTGSPPSLKQIQTGFSPQLPLTAAILARGGYEGAAVKTLGDLIYVRITGRKPAGETIRPLDKAKEPTSAAAEAEAAWEGLQKLIARYDDPDQGYPSRTAPQFVKTYASDYDHLARVYEWSTAADADIGGEGE